MITCIHTCVQTCMHTYILTYTIPDHTRPYHPYIPFFKHVCFLDVFTFLHACMTSLHSYTFTVLHVLNHMSIYPYICNHLYIHPYIYTSMHTHHIHIHTYTYTQFCVVYIHIDIRTLSTLCIHQMYLYRRIEIYIQV